MPSGEFAFVDLRSTVVVSERLVGHFEKHECLVGHFGKHACRVGLAKNFNTCSVKKFNTTRVKVFNTHSVKKFST